MAKRSTWPCGYRKEGTYARWAKNNIQQHSGPVFHSRTTRGGSSFTPRQRLDKRSGPVFQGRTFWRGGLVLHQDIGEPFHIETPAQRTPAVASQEGDARYILKTKKLPININAQQTPETDLLTGDLRYKLEDETQKRRFGGSDHGSRVQSDYASPEDIGEDDGAFGKSAEKDEEARRDTERDWTRCSASEETSTISIKSRNRMLKYLLPPKRKKKNFPHGGFVFFQKFCLVYFFFLILLTERKKKKKFFFFTHHKQSVFFTKFGCFIKFFFF